MAAGRLLASLALAGGVLFACGYEAARAADDATQAIELPDEMVDAMLRKDLRGLPGSGGRPRLLAELNPELYAELRQLTRRMHFAAPSDYPALMSELSELNGRVGEWLTTEVRASPLRALDALLTAVRGRLAMIERAGPRFCGVYSWGDRSTRLELNQVSPAAVTAIDLAYYKAAAASRAVPTRHAPIDEAMWMRLFDAIVTAGASQEQVVAVFDPEARAPFTLAERCVIERHFMAALASLADEDRGSVLAVVFGGQSDLDE